MPHNATYMTINCYCYALRWFPPLQVSLVLFLRRQGTLWFLAHCSVATEAPNCFISGLTNMKPCSGTTIWKKQYLLQ